MSIKDEMRDVRLDEPAPNDWPKSGLLSRALAYSRWRIGNNNRQANLVNGGVRVPLDSPLNKL
jgi:hypothetical protein